MVTQVSGPHQNSKKKKLTQQDYETTRRLSIGTRYGLGF